MGWWGHGRRLEIPVVPFSVKINFFLDGQLRFRPVGETPGLQLANLLHSFLVNQRLFSVLKLKIHRSNGLQTYVRYIVNPIYLLNQSVLDRTTKRQSGTIRPLTILAEMSNDDIDGGYWYVRKENFGVFFFVYKIREQSNETVAGLRSREIRAAMTASRCRFKRFRFSCGNSISAKGYITI